MHRLAPAVVLLLAAAPALAQEATPAEPTEPATRPAGPTDRQRAMALDVRQMAAALGPMFRQMGTLLEADGQADAAAASTALADRIDAAQAEGTIDALDRPMPPERVESMARAALDNPGRVRGQMRQLHDDLPPLAEAIEPEEPALAAFMLDLSGHAGAYLAATPAVESELAAEPEMVADPDAVAEPPAVAEPE